MKRSRFGSVVQFPDRDGHWFRKRYRGRTYVKYAGRTEAAGERFRTRVYALVLDGVRLKDAIAHVAGDPPPLGTHTTFAELCEQYEGAIEYEGTKKPSTRDRDRYALGIVKDAPWAQRPAEELERGDVRAWTNRLRRGCRTRDAISGGTVNNLLSLCSAVLRHAQESNWIDDSYDNPFPRCRVRPKNVIRKLRAGLDLDELRTFLAAAEGICPRPAYRMLLAGAVIGWRLGDYVALRRADVDLGYVVKEQPAAVIRLAREQEKTGCLKIAFLVGPLLSEVSAILNDPDVRRLDTASLFTQGNGRVWNSGCINAWIGRVMAEIPDARIPAWKKTGDGSYSRFTFHGLRYTARTVMAQLGISAYVIDAQVGHKTPGRVSMAHHYTTVSELELLAAANTVSTAVASDLVASSESLGTTRGTTAAGA